MSIAYINFLKGSIAHRSLIGAEPMLYNAIVSVLNDLDNLQEENKKLNEVIDKMSKVITTMCYIENIDDNSEYIKKQILNKVLGI